MNNAAENITLFWNRLPLHFQAALAVFLIILFGSESLNFGRQLGSALYRALH
jgi:hypothetical protein